MLRLKGFRHNSNLIVSKSRTVTKTETMQIKTLKRFTLNECHCNLMKIGSTYAIWQKQSCITQSESFIRKEVKPYISLAILS